MKEKLPDNKNFNIKSSLNKVKNKTEAMTTWWKNNYYLVATIVALIFFAALSSKPIETVEIETVENDLMMSEANISMCIMIIGIVGYICLILLFSKVIREIIKTTLAILILVSICIGVAILVNYALTIDWSPLLKVLPNMF